MEKETKWDRAKREILRTLPQKEKEAKTSKEVATGLEFDINRTYVANLLMQMAEKRIVCHKKVPYGNGFCYWSKARKEQIQNKGTRRRVTDNILMVLSDLKGDETITAIEIEQRLRELKLYFPTGSISAALTEMYRKHSVKRSKSVYKRKYWYWLKGDKKEKNIENGIELKHYFVSDPNPTGKTETQLEQANELHNLNVSLRELVGKYRNNNKKLKQIIDSRDKEIAQQKSRIANLHSELQNITATIKTEQDVVKDIFKSRKILEDTFK